MHSFPVHMKKKAPQTEAVGPSYTPNTSKNLSLTLGPGQKIGQKINPSGFRTRILQFSVFYILAL